MSRLGVSLLGCVWCSQQLERNWNSEEKKLGRVIDTGLSEINQSKAHKVFKESGWLRKLGPQMSSLFRICLWSDSVCSRIRVKERQDPVRHTLTGSVSFGSEGKKKSKIFPEHGVRILERKNCSLLESRIRVYIRNSTLLLLTPGGDIHILPG